MQDLKLIKHSPEIERRVLNWLMYTGDVTNLSLQQAMLRLTVSCFYNQAGKYIFKLIQDCYKQRLSFDELQIMDLLKDAPKDVYDYFTQAIHTGYKENIIPDDIDILICNWHLRLKIREFKNVLQNLANEPIPQNCNNLIMQSINNLGVIQFGKDKQGSTTEQIVDRYLTGFYKDDERIATNLACLDSGLEGGFHNCSLITVAGDSGVGKTNFCLYLMHNLSLSLPEKQTLYFNMEMPENQMWQRLVSIIAGKRFESFNDYERDKFIAQSLDHPTTFFDENLRNIADIETMCRIKAMEKPISVIVIDYLTLISNPGIFERNDLKQTDITTRLGQLALSLNCIIIAASQVNRNAGTRAKDDRCPYPTDASDSMGSFKTSSCWIGLERPELYLQDEHYKNKFVAKIRKNRNGQVFDAVFDFNKGTFAQCGQEQYFSNLPKSPKQSSNIVYC